MRTNIYPNIWQAVIYVFAFLVLSFGYFTVLYSLVGKIPRGLFKLLEFMGRFIYFLPLILILIRRSNVNLKKQIFAPNLKELIIMVFSTGLLFSLYYFLAHPDNLNNDFAVSLPFFGIIVLAPIFEEIFFRGLILHQFLKKYRTHWAILFSSLLFAISHFNLRIMIPTFIFSILISLIYYRFRQSLILAVLSHIIWNFLIEVI